MKRKYAFLILLGLLFTATLSRAAPILFIHDDSARLARVDVETGIVDEIGTMAPWIPEWMTTGPPVTMTDIAFDNSGNLYGITFWGFYRINLQTAHVSYIGEHNVPGGNALVFAPSGTLYAAGNISNQLWEIDPATGAGNAVANIGYYSSGDLAFFDGNNDGSVELYLSSTSNELIEMDPSLIPTSSPTGASIGVSKGPIGFSNVFGLANASNNVLYGVAGTNIIAVDPSTGSGSFVVDYGNQGLRASYGSSFFLGAPGDAPIPVTTDQNCPPTIDQRRSNLVVVVHGTSSNPGRWANELVTYIDLRQSDRVNTDWDVCAYDWTAGADATANGGLISGIPFGGVWNNAERLGAALGRSICEGRYQNIHLIAHSVGSQLIQSAVDTIEARSLSGFQADNHCYNNKPTIHMTFLDAYDPGIPNIPYGRSADWAEHFFDTSSIRVPGTDHKLKLAFNYEISDLDTTDSYSNHEWPHEWYRCTARHSFQYPPFAYDLCGGHMRKGFMNSLEYGLLEDLPSHTYQGANSRYYPQSGLCTLLDGGFVAEGGRECGSTSPPEVVSVPENIFQSTPALPREVVLSSTGYVDIGSLSSIYNELLIPSVDLYTGSPAWVSVLFETANSFDSLKLDYEYLATGDGILSILLDGDVVFIADETSALTGINSPHPILVGNREAGLHTLTLRLDPSLTSQSIARVTNLSVGTYSIEVRDTQTGTSTGGGSSGGGSVGLLFLTMLICAGGLKLFTVRNPN